MEDVVIIGGGISAHTAALYTARASLNPLVFHGKGLDQLSLTTVVENYPGFPEGVLGPELIDNCKRQAERFGARYVNEDVDAVTKVTQGFEVKAGGKAYATRTVLVCTGASARRLNIPGEDEYFGKGVSTCAVCDAALYRGKTAVVAGGGDSAMEETLALYKFAKKIYLVHRRDVFRASKIMQDRVIKLKDKVEIILNTTILDVFGDGKFVQGVNVQEASTNRSRKIACDGVFLAIGHVPNTGFLKKLVKLDEHGYVLTDKLGKTNVDGIYAAGDCQDPVFRQAVTSAGSGCMAALQAERYLEHLKASGTY